MYGDEYKEAVENAFSKAIPKMGLSFPPGKPLVPEISPDHWQIRDSLKDSTIFC